MCPLSGKAPTFHLERLDETFKGSLAWAAASQSPSYLISDGRGKLYFKDKSIVVDKYGASFLATGQTYCISMQEFELIREIGRGQFGLVLLVRHRPSNKLMALKDLRLEVSEYSIKQIMTELDILTKAESSYILEFYGAFHNRSSVFLCLEYMEAGSMEDLYRTKGPIPENALAAMAYSVVKGMRFLSKELHVIHRDVKPSNILVNRAGQVKLCDFGISGYLIRSLARTQIGSMCYMAPERIVLDKPTEYNVKADIWSLGISLLESGTGVPVYPAQKFDSPFAQLMTIVNDPPPQLTSTKFSPVFQSFISNCLKKDPNERASFDQLLAHELLKSFDRQEQDPTRVIRDWLGDVINEPCCDDPPPPPPPPPPSKPTAIDF